MITDSEILNMIKYVINDSKNYNDPFDKIARIKEILNQVMISYPNTDQGKCQT